MKNSIILLFIMLLFNPYNGQSQFKKILKKKGEKSTEKAIDKGIDNLLGGKKENVKEEKKETEMKEVNESTGEPVSNESTAKNNDVSPSKPELTWSKYDFVPGDQIIFEDNLTGEENGEFPSRWDLIAGSVEIAEVDGENVIMFRGGTPKITPYFTNPKDDHLPDVFTIEFDLYYPGSGTFKVYLYDRKNQSSGSNTGYTYFNISSNKIEFGMSSAIYPGENLAKARWMHISIAYTSGKLKAYMDDTRLINLPRIDFDPKGLTFDSYHANNKNLYYVKNVRIAEGGVKYYDRVLNDGKIIVHGIRFDVNKATLKPESMGAINEIYSIMEKNPVLKFSVEGHTDSDGDNDFNQKLSEQRAEAVKDKLIEMGISPDRLTSKGFGESIPIASNDTPEGKANNRRVEFVKID